MLRHDCRNGQEVSFKWKGTRYFGKVTKMNPKKAKVATHTPAVHPCVNVPYSLLRDETGGAAPTTPPAPSVRHHLGTVVKADSLAVGTLFVVIGHHGEGHRIAKLGGDKGRYYTGIDGSLLEVVAFNVSGV